MSQIKYLRVCSDLHLEFHRSRPLQNNLLDYLPPDLRDRESVLVLAGDIHNNNTQLLLALTFLRERFAEIFFIPGNHDYYGNDIEDWQDVRDKSPTPFMGNQLYPIRFQLSPELALVGITLWGDGGGDDWFKNRAISKMNDFRQIQKNKVSFRIEDMMRLNKEQSLLLSKTIKHGKIIVVTHHLPSYQLCDPRHSPSDWDGLFASDQEVLMSGLDAPALWICGHTHHHIDRKLGDTRILCNPAGYPGEGNTGYEPRCFVDLQEF